MMHCYFCRHNFEPAGHFPTCPDCKSSNCHVLSAYAGSFDHLNSKVQLEQVDLAMTMYFGRADWLAERNKLMRGLA